MPEFFEKIKLLNEEKLEYLPVVTKLRNKLTDDELVQIQENYSNF